MRCFKRYNMVMARTPHQLKMIALALGIILAIVVSGEVYRLEEQNLIAAEPMAKKIAIGFGMFIALPISTFLLSLIGVIGAYECANRHSTRNRTEEALLLSNMKRPGTQAHAASSASANTAML